jgi:hypothetical protein
VTGTFDSLRDRLPFGDDPDPRDDQDEDHKLQQPSNPISPDEAIS